MKRIQFEFWYKQNGSPFSKVSQSDTLERAIEMRKKLLRNGKVITSEIKQIESEYLSINFNKK